MLTNKPNSTEGDEPKIERWTAQRKAAIILDVLKGAIFKVTTRTRVRIRKA